MSPRTHRSPSAYGEGCAAAHALDLVGERWALLVVRELLLGSKRFTDLRTGILHASHNMLAKGLRKLDTRGRHQLVGARRPDGNGWAVQQLPAHD